MSALLAVVNTITSTPLPSPQVIKETLQPIVQQVPVVPPQVLELVQTLALAGAVAFVSVVHQLVERGRLGGTANRLIVAGYTLAASLGTAALTGHLGTGAGDLQVEITSFLVALGAALGRYEYLWKLLLDIFQGVLPKPAPLASDDNPPVESAV
jgi:hypothetical protein